MFSYGLMLHHLCDDVHPRGQGAIDAQELASIIEFMGPRNFLGAHEWTERALAGRLEPHHRCITLDDALLCQYDVARPVFEAYGLTAFFFVYSSVFEGRRERMEILRHFRTTRYDDIEDFYSDYFRRLGESEDGAAFIRLKQDFEPRNYLSNYPFYSDNDRLFRYTRDVLLGPDKYFAIIDALIAGDSGYDVDKVAPTLWMANEHIQDLHAKGHIIGLHSYSHPTALANLSPEEQREQYTRNASHLEAILGIAPVTVSHPLNSYGPETLDILRSLGVRVGFRDNLALGPNASLLEMPRDDHSNILKQIRK